MILTPSDKAALQIIRLAVEQNDRLTATTTAIVEMLLSSASLYAGDEVVYSGEHVSNILKVEADRIKLKASSL